MIVFFFYPQEFSVPSNHLSCSSKGRHAWKVSTTLPNRKSWHLCQYFGQPLVQISTSAAEEFSFLRRCLPDGTAELNFISELAISWQRMSLKEYIQKRKKNKNYTSLSPQIYCTSSDCELIRLSTTCCDKTGGRCARFTVSEWKYFHFTKRVKLRELERIKEWPLNIDLCSLVACATC